VRPCLKNKTKKQNKNSATCKRDYAGELNDIYSRNARLVKYLQGWGHGSRDRAPA
jgi:hypothetical protein